MARRRRSSSFDPTLSHGIIAIILVIVAIIIGLSFFGKAGTVGIILDEWILSFLFGRIRYATPIVIVVLAWFLVKDDIYDYRKTHLAGAALFFLSFSSLLHIGFAPDNMWTEAIAGHGGGVFGMGAWPLKTYLGSIAGIVLLIGMIAVSIVLIFNTSITSFVMMHKKLFERMGWFGDAVTTSTKKLFVPNDEDDEEYDEDEEDEEGERRFFSKNLSDEDEEEYDEDEAEDEEEEDEEETEHEVDDEEDEEDVPLPTLPQHGATNPQEVPGWLQNVLIKPIPPTTLLTTKKGKPTSGDIKSNQQVIEDTLREFRIDVTMGDVRVGPTVTQYSLKPAKGVKLSRITGLSNDLALALAAHPIRIEAPIPGKSLVGIEVPNEKTAMVSFKELLESKNFKQRDHNMMIALGKDVAGKSWFADLPRMPHLLIAGATGSGKTVCVNTILMSLLYQNTAETLRMILVDPKRVELTMYNGIPHLLTPVITNTQQTVNALKWTISEMERRFELLSAAGNRNIVTYNEKAKQKLPYIVFVIDELADLMAAASNDVEAGIIRLAQMARAVGIHLILATQRPSVDVITGLMKANIPGRIAFSVASLTDSRTILDAAGAEKLLGRGDMLFSTAELSKPTRIQAAFLSEEEAKRVIKHLKGKEKPIYDESIVSKQQGGGTMNMFGGPSDDQDALFHEAKQLILDAGKASASFLQRRLKVGYARAARILDELEDAGIIGPADGAKPREILVTEREIETTMNMGGELNVYKSPPAEEVEEPSEEDEEEYDEQDEELPEDDEYVDGETEDEEYDDDEGAEEDADEGEYEEEDDEEYEDDEEEIDDEEDDTEYVGYDDDEEDSRKRE